MIGVVLISHGEMASGLKNTIEMFFGKDIAQVEAVSFMENEDVESFDKKLKEAINKVDDGSGVLAFTDMLGGTPANRCALLLSNQFYVVTGMNLPIIMEFLGKRASLDNIGNYQINEDIKFDNNGIVLLNDKFKSFIEKKGE